MTDLWGTAGQQVGSALISAFGTVGDISLFGVGILLYALLFIIGRGMSLEMAPLVLIPLIGLLVSPEVGLLPLWLGAILAAAVGFVLPNLFKQFEGPG